MLGHLFYILVFSDFCASSRLSFKCVLCMCVIHWYSILYLNLFHWTCLFVLWCASILILLKRVSLRWTLGNFWLVYYCLIEGMESWMYAYAQKHLTAYVKLVDALYRSLIHILFSTYTYFYLSLIHFLKMHNIPVYWCIYYLYKFHLFTILVK